MDTCTTGCGLSRQGQLELWGTLLKLKLLWPVCNVFGARITEFDWGCVQKLWVFALESVFFQMEAGTGAYRSGFIASTIEWSCQGRLTVDILTNRDARSVLSAVLTAVV